MKNFGNRARSLFADFKSCIDALILEGFIQFGNKALGYQMRFGQRIDTLNVYHHTENE